MSLPKRLHDLFKEVASSGLVTTKNVTVENLLEFQNLLNQSLPTTPEEIAHKELIRSMHYSNPVGFVKYISLARNRVGALVLYTESKYISKFFGLKGKAHISWDEEKKAYTVTHHMPRERREKKESKVDGVDNTDPTHDVDNTKEEFVCDYGGVPENYDGELPIFELQDKPESKDVENVVDNSTHSTTVDLGSAQRYAESVARRNAKDGYTKYNNKYNDRPNYPNREDRPRYKGADDNTDREQRPGRYQNDEVPPKGGYQPRNPQARDVRPDRYYTKQEANDPNFVETRREKYVNRHREKVNAKGDRKYIPPLQLKTGYAGGKKIPREVLANARPLKKDPIKQHLDMLNQKPKTIKTSEGIDYGRVRNNSNNDNTGAWAEYDS
jgi:hypothetical protein